MTGEEPASEIVSGFEAFMRFKGVYDGDNPITFSDNGQTYIVMDVERQTLASQPDAGLGAVSVSATVSPVRTETGSDEIRLLEGTLTFPITRQPFAPEFVTNQPNEEQPQSE